MADTETDENMQDGSPNPSSSSSRPAGKEGSLKHRILSRPATTGNCSDDTLSVSSHSGTPVPSPSSSHSDTRMDTNTPPKKRARISDRNSNASPTTPHSDLSKSTNSTPSAPRSEASTPSRSPNPGQPVLPNRFNRGSLIQLANGDLKAIEVMSSDDFVNSAAASPNLKVEFSEIARVDRHMVNGVDMVVVSFRVGSRSPEVAVEASDDHPFFVLGKGWASPSPAATHARFGLRVSQLVAGDTCISLSYKEFTPGPSDGSMTGGRLSERNVRPPDASPSMASTTAAAAVDPRIFNLTGSDLASFRRWSAPEDDRFMDNLPKQQ